jgi:hypothetical protein
MEEKTKSKNTTGKALAFSLSIWVGYIILVLLILLIFFRI